MPLRNNAYNRFQPDAYGNSSNSMLPPGTIRPSKGLSMRDKDSELKPFSVGIGDYNKTIFDADKKAKELDKQLIKAPEKEEVEFDKGAATMAAAQGALGGYQSGGSGGAGGGGGVGAKLNIGQGGGKAGRQARRAARIDAKGSGKDLGGGGGFSKGGAAGVGAASAVVGMAGAQQTANKNEDVGGAMSGAAAGASMGMMLGPWGAAAGAVIGGVAGYFSGKGKKKKRLKAEKKAAAARAAHNREIAKQKYNIKAKASELAKYQRITEAGSRYDQHGNLRYKSGGALLKYKTIDAIEVARIKSIYEAPKEEEKPRSIVKEFKKGGTLEDTKKPEKIVFKMNNDIPVFRRGGKMDLQKQNVIVDGPSHDELNKTGVDGDKGIPVVSKNAKVAEIESRELVINKKSSAEIEELVKKAKKDPKAQEELGELLSKELAENTYDYTKELLED